MSMRSNQQRRLCSIVSHSRLGLGLSVDATHRLKDFDGDAFDAGGGDGGHPSHHCRF
jgi:hypothetical protein